MLYKFYCKYECNYNGRMLYYGNFSGDKPCWNADIGGDKIEPLVVVDEKVSKEKVVYRLSGRKGANTRFTYQKIARTAIPSKDSVILKRREDHIPS